MSKTPIPLSIPSEYGTLAHVIAGRGDGFHRDPSRVDIVNTTQQASGHPSPSAVAQELSGFHQALRDAGVAVHIPELAPESVQDQTCPRDIGFVIGDTFITANMTDPSRTEEIAGIKEIIGDCVGTFIDVPGDTRLEGGDVLVDGSKVFVGHGQRSDEKSAQFLITHFPSFEIVPLRCVHGTSDVDVLHLDCAFNPLGLGHALIYPKGLAEHPDALHHYDWIEVTDEEAYGLATNVLSIAPDHIIARDHPICSRVNAILKQLGYAVTEVAFDAVPSIGGSFRCATLPLQRRK